MSWVRDWKYIPKEAFLYFPKDEQIKRGSGNTISRRIFETGQPYDEFERQKLRQLNQSLSRKQVAVIPWFTQANKLRFLQAKKFDVEEARKSIIEHCKWRSQTFPISYTKEVTAFLTSGAIYFCGRDNCFRPIVVIDIAKFNLNDAESQKIGFLSKIIATFFEFMIEQLYIEGQVENYVMIVNLNNEGVWSIGGLMKTILNFTTNTYRSRLYAAYIVNSPKTITVVWNTGKGLLSESTVRKVNFLNHSVPQPLFAHCNRDQIEVKFSGSKPNITGNFWPPLCLTQKHQYPHSRLLSQSEYVNMWKQGKFKQRKICKEIIDNADRHNQQRSQQEIHYSAKAVENRQSAHMVGHSNELIINYQHTPNAKQMTSSRLPAEFSPNLVQGSQILKGTPSMKSLPYQNLRESMERYVPQNIPLPVPGHIGQQNMQINSHIQAQHLQNHMQPQQMQLPMHYQQAHQQQRPQSPQYPPPQSPQYQPPMLSAPQIHPSYGNTSNKTNKTNMSQNIMTSPQKIIPHQSQNSMNVHIRQSRQNYQPNTQQKQLYQQSRQRINSPNHHLIPSIENIEYRRGAGQDSSGQLNPTNSISRNLDLPFETDMHINQIKTIRTFFDLSTYKNMKRMYYQYI